MQTTLLWTAVVLLLVAAVLGVAGARAPQPSRGERPRGRARQYYLVMVVLNLIAAVLLFGTVFM